MSNVRSTLLNVEGMSCGSCVRHVDAALRELEGVRKVDIRLREGEVLVEHEADKPDLSSIIETLRGAGYPATAG